MGYSQACNLICVGYRPLESARLLRKIVFAACFFHHKVPFFRISKVMRNPKLEAALPATSSSGTCQGEYAVARCPRCGLRRLPGQLHSLKQVSAGRFIHLS
ncbi:hypothetical protein IF1G_05635 [Cordyceps javanica]|uniref:Uncharacterized protein n=1 Tax=Cordyceps javanica TaxID=43265 RepID=A0A545V267_9HYPO|nr:hypothetical protein IF1G_05635 [Cordyceps javanica]